MVLFSHTVKLLMINIGTAGGSVNKIFSSQPIDTVETDSLSLSRSLYGRYRIAQKSVLSS